jgi:hypothetical protein
LIKMAHYEEKCKYVNNEFKKAQEECLKCQQQVNFRIRMF